MVKLDVCLEMVLTDLPYEQRIKKIAECGYGSVEFWFHDATFDGASCTTDQPKDPKVLRDACAASGVTINNMVLNAPDGSFGGAPVDAGDLNKYLERLDEVIAFANAAGCTSAITCSGNLQPGLSRDQMRANLETALSKAAAVAEKKGFTLFLEPLNTYVDHEGYYLDSSDEAAEIVRKINSPNFRLLFDVYHMQIMQGNVISRIRGAFDVIGHFHAAGVPGRNELFGNELNYAAIVKAIDELGYKGKFGLEYAPAMPDHIASLKAVRDSLQGVAE